MRTITLTETEAEQYVDNLRLSQLFDSLRSRRNELQISADEVGEVVGVTSATIYNWETQKSSPRLAQLLLWAKTLDLQLRFDLVTLDEDMGDMP